MNRRRRASRRHTAALSATAAILAFSVCAAVAVGPAGLSVRDVVAVVGGHLGLGDPGVSALRDAIVWELRLPRVLLAAVVGCGLALCGAVLQSLTRNPLADPYLLGASSGASTGAVLVLVVGVGSGPAALSVGAFAGSMLAFALVLALAGHQALVSPTRVVLAGIAGTQLFAALTSFMIIWEADAEHTRSITFWLLGSLSAAHWNDVAICTAVVVAGLAACLWSSSALDAFAFGGDAAAALGVAVRPLRLALLVTTAFVTAALVASSGAVGFLGLVLPHAARLLVGPRHRVLLPATALVGAVFLVWIDTAARTLFDPREIPVGVLTALVGVPAFAVILRRRGARA